MKNASQKRGGARSTRRRAGLLAVAYAVRFLIVAAIITVAVFVQQAAAERFGADKGAIALIMLVVVVFLSLALTVFELLIRKFTVERPVARIGEMARRIASGDFSVRADIAHTYGNYDEYDCILLDLERAAAELAEADKTRTDFVSNVSHELKTPLAVILSYAQALEKDDLSDGTRREYLLVLRKTAERLAALVHNVLRLNRLEHRKLGGERQSVALHEQLAQCILQFEDAIEQKGLSLDCDLEEVTIISDMGCLELVWNNLLSNAVKFTDAGGSIRVSLKEDDFLVFMSDGITAAFGSSADLCAYLSGLHPVNPQALAENVLQSALSLAKGTDDDMTVLAVKLTAAA